MKYLILAFVKVFTLKIRYLYLNFYFLNIKNKYIFLDTSLNIIFFAAWSNPNKRKNILAKKSIKQILHKQIKKKMSMLYQKIFDLENKSR